MLIQIDGGNGYLNQSDISISFTSLYSSNSGRNREELGEEKRLLMMFHTYSTKGTLGMHKFLYKNYWIRIHSPREYPNLCLLSRKFVSIHSDQHYLKSHIATLTKIGAQYIGGKLSCCQTDDCEMDRARRGALQRDGKYQENNEVLLDDHYRILSVNVHHI